MNIRQVEWKGKPAVAIAYTTDRQQAVNILMFVILGATFGLSLALLKSQGLFALIPIPVVVIVTVDALRQRVFILMDAKRRFLTGVKKGMLFTSELFMIQVVRIIEISVEDSATGATQVVGLEAGKKGGTRKFHVIAKSRGGNILICSTSSPKNATLIAYAVSRAVGKRLGGRVDLRHWRSYVDVLEEEEKEVLQSLISDRGRALE